MDKIGDMGMEESDNRDGLEILRVIRKERPGTYTILTTVYGDSEIEKWRGRWVCRSIFKSRCLHQTY